MIIQCPACATRYVVPDTAIGVDGRTVRCAKCRHSWFQDGPPPPTPGPAPAPEAAPEQAPEPAREPEPVHAPAPPPPAVAATPPVRQTLAEPEDDEQPTAPLPDPPRQQPAEAPLPPPPIAAHGYGDTDEPSQFDAAPPFRRRRNPLRMWSWAAGIFALVAAGTILAVSFWGLPDWVPVERPTFAAAEPDLQLDFPPEQQERRRLPNGTEFFGASGTITNIGTTARPLPTILIVLRDARDRIVYSWEVAPPQRSLAPGESVTVNEAVTDIPRSARFAYIGWKPD